MGETAENLVEKFNISREDQDEFAYKSQMKATDSQKNGRLAREIIPVEIPRRKADPIIFDSDEFVKSNTTFEILSKLKPAFKEGSSVTAGNASGLNDGACSMIITSKDACKKSNLKPRAKIVSSAVVGVEPRIMGIGPVGASQSIAVLRELGLNENDSRLNPNGGAIALGHPLGMSGARLLTTAMIELEEKNLQRVLCTMCIGVGQVYAAIIERVN